MNRVFPKQHVDLQYSNKSFINDPRSCSSYFSHAPSSTVTGRHTSLTFSIRSRKETPRKRSTGRLSFSNTIYSRRFHYYYHAAEGNIPAQQLSLTFDSLYNENYLYHDGLWMAPIESRISAPTVPNAQLDKIANAITATATATTATYPMSPMLGDDTADVGLMSTAPSLSTEHESLIPYTASETPSPRTTTKKQFHLSLHPLTNILRLFTKGKGKHQHLHPKHECSTNSRQQTNTDAPCQAWIRL